MTLGITLKKEVVSVKLALEMQKVGIKGRNVFSWYMPYKCNNEYYVALSGGTSEEDKEVAPAYTVAELAEILPRRFWCNMIDEWGFPVIKTVRSVSDFTKEWMILYETLDRDKVLRYFYGESLIIALANAVVAIWRELSARVPSGQSEEGGK